MGIFPPLDLSLAIWPGETSEVREARARIVEAASLLWHHGDVGDPLCTQEGNQALRAVHAAYDALTPGGDLAADVRAREEG